MFRPDKETPDAPGTPLAGERGSSLGLASFRFRATNCGFLLWVVLLAAGGAISPAATSESAHFLNLPAAFAQKVRDRETIDHFQVRFHAVETNLPAVPYQPVAKQVAERRGAIRTVRPRWNEAAHRYRLSLPRERFTPLPGYRAPVLAQTQPFWPAQFPTNETRAGFVRAAELCQRQLAHDGLLPTVASIVHAIGPSQFDTNAAAALQQLRAVGFPVDWLEFFELRGQADRPAPINLLAAVGAALSRGETNSLFSDLQSALFRFRPSAPGFQLSPEQGEHSVGLLRVQIGGGYDRGMVPGSSLDFTGRLVEALPEVNFVVTVEEGYFEPVRWLAGHCWPLRRLHHVTLIAHPLSVSAWTQDNGKPGIISAAPSGKGQHALMLPRYASIAEREARFVPGESFIAEGLQAAGLAILQSPLLFQGGNLIAVRDPVTGRRSLLLGEGTVHQNVALGLSSNQVLEAFRLEFDVDECVVLPAVSYHLDYDLTIRRVGESLVAFVNDPDAAARIMAGLGINALEDRRLCTGAEARLMREQLAEANRAEALQVLSRVLRRHRNPDGKFQARLAQAFTAGNSDSPEANLQCFLVALDWLGEGGEVTADSTPEAQRRMYRGAWQRMKATIIAQQAAFQARGWKIVRVPSMPDVNRSINYLNGLHDRDRWFMPAWNGFYAALDRAAAAAFAPALGNGVKVVPLFCNHAQTIHGAVHCMVSAFPRL